MTNFEKYFPHLTDTAFGLLNGKVVRCKNLRCDNCTFYSVGSCCPTKRMQWLKAEYEEPKISIPDDTPIDSKVLVSSNGTNWYKRHYAGIKNGRHHVWNDGKTSWSCEPDEIIQWEYMKLYE